MPRLLDLLKPAISYMPEVTKSKRKVTSYWLYNLIFRLKWEIKWYGQE